MRIIITCFALLLVLFSGNIQAQNTKDATVALSATVSFSPVAITLNWPSPAAANILILRREKGQAGNQWVQVANLMASTATTFTDQMGITMGKTYEYVIQQATTFNAYGYVHVAVQAPVTDTRGKILVFVDSTTADAIGVELVRMKNDMRGDGWVAVPYKVGPSSTVASVKAQILADYNADPTNVKAVLLIGDVPIPYSGNANWDGHPDHQGAWPADSYYADVNGTWTDSGVNNTSPARDANDNIPGDGKFDQSIIPTAVELQVGRVDFRRLNAAAFGESNAIGLVKRYLDKNHAFRTGAYKVENKALVDDNFGYFGGEAFAASGYRNAYPLVGESNIVAADFFNNTNPETWLLGYGCGGGWYQGASGVGSSANFATDTINIVFSNLFGSYHGDWDYEVDPFMPSALASRGGILTCSWAGRPHWFNQALASGETIGYCHKETQNAQYNNGFFQSLVGESGAHTALLGDPTLRAHVVAPPQNIVLKKVCNEVLITWNSPSDPVDGYHVYRSLSNDGPYTRITSNLLNENAFIDATPVDDTLFYQVRAIKSQTSPGGGVYLNNSIGPIEHMVFQTTAAPVATIQGGTLTCDVLSVELSATSSSTLTEWQWDGPGMLNSNDTTFTTTVPGNYQLTVKDDVGCTGTSSIFIEANTIPPVLSVTSSGILTCANTNSTLTVNSASQLDPSGFSWSNGGNTASIVVSDPNVYAVVAVDAANGCSSTAQFTLQQDIQAPSIDLEPSYSYNCTEPCAIIPLNFNNLDYYLDTNPVSEFGPLVLCTEATHLLSVVDTTNGCITEYQVVVESDVLEPGANIGGSTVLTCQAPSIQLMGSTMSSNPVYHWSGPGITAANQNQQNPTIDLAGTYTLVVSDGDNGCTSMASVVIVADQSIPTATAEGDAITCVDLIADLQCTTNSQGATFLWTGPEGFLSTEQNTATVLPGQYNLVVTSSSGCSVSLQVTVVADNQAPQFNAPGSYLLTCGSPCDTIEIEALTPILPLTPLEVCAPGVYSIVVTGLNGCQATASVTVEQAPPFIASLDPAFVDCDGTAAISAVVSGGVMPYSYLWSNGSTFSSALFILDGTPISVTIHDNSGCSWESGPVTIVNPPQIGLTGTVTNASGGNANGAINLMVSGGTPPFSFNWSNGQTTEDINTLSAGTYTVTVTETGTGCTAEASFVVSGGSNTNESALVQSLELAPNPTSGLAYLNLTLFEPMEGTFELHDALGRLVSSQNLEKSDRFAVQIDMSAQPTGVYWIALTFEGQVISRKLVKSDR